MHEQQAGGALVSLAALIQRRFSEVCADHDLTPAQAQLLCMVKDHPRGLTELSRLLGLARPGLSGLVDRIERRGLVQRDNPAHDRRAVTLSTTASGQRTVDALYADVTSRLPELLDGVAPEDRRVFERVVAQITGGGPCLSVPEVSAADRRSRCRTAPPPPGPA